MTKEVYGNDVNSVALRGITRMKWTCMIEKYVRERRGERPTVIDNVM